MDSAVDVFSAQVSKLSTQLGDNDRCIYVYDIALRASALNVRPLLFFSVRLLSSFLFCVLVLFVVENLAKKKTFAY